MASPILIFTFSGGKHGAIKKGISSGKNLVYHSLRLEITNKSISYINPTRSKNNQFFNYLQNKPAWQAWNKNYHEREKIYHNFNHHLNSRLDILKDQLRKQNMLYQKRSEYSNVKTFKNFIGSKQPIGELIIGASREFFVENKIIEIIDNKNFRTIDKKKLQIWRNQVQKFAIQEITRKWGRKNLILSSLHLDESNVHIHTQFFQTVMSYDKRKACELLKVKSSFRKNELINMHERFLKFCNQEIILKHNWVHQLKLHEHQYTRKAYHLLQYKSQQLEEVIAKKKAIVKRYDIVLNATYRKKVKIFKLKVLNLVRETNLQKNMQFLQKCHAIGFTKKELKFVFGNDYNFELKIKKNNHH